MTTLAPKLSATGDASASTAVAGARPIGARAMTGLESRAIDDEAAEPVKRKTRASAGIPLTAERTSTGAVRFRLEPRQEALGSDEPWVFSARTSDPPVIGASRRPRPRLPPSRTSVFLVLLALACLLPRAARGTVGFAERHSRLQYNDLAAIHWVESGDGCNQGKTCFFLEKKEKGAGSFRGLYASLRKVSVPPGRAVSLVMGEWSSGGWFLYDLRAERLLVENAPYGEVLASWKANGLPEPSIADTANLSDAFRETWASRLEGFVMLGLLLSPLIVLSLPFLLLLLVWCFFQFRRTRHKSFLAVAALLLPPVAVAVFLLVRILAVLPRTR
jgi:hypothetical protein